MSLGADALTDTIIGSAIAVHRRLGPGLLESAYEQALAYELAKVGLLVERQVPFDLVYDEVTLETAYRLDILVERQVVVEVKSVEGLRPIHGLQLATYLRLGNYPYGLLINFNMARLVDGVQRKRNDRLVHPSSSSS